MIRKISLTFISSLFFIGSIFADNETNAACPTIVMSGTDVDCYGGSNGTAKVAISNGSGDYTRSWSTTPVANSTEILGLSVGTYTVTVYDNISGCTVVGAFVVGSPDPISVTEVITDVNCFDENTGNISLTTLGGNGSYMYAWTNGTGNPVGTNSANLTNVGADTYTVIITDSKGCSLTKIYTISEPIEALNSSSIVVNTDCFGTGTGSIDINVWGGTPPYAYTWNTSQSTQDISNLTMGNYSVHIEDALNCSIDLAFNITQPAVLQGIVSSTAVLCFGEETGIATLSASGGTLPYSYSWQNSTSLYSSNSNVLSNVVADDYQVTLTDGNGCQYVDYVTVDQPSKMTGSIVSTNVSCFGGNDGEINLTVAGGVTIPVVSYLYNWTNSVPTPVGSTQDLINIVAETYSVVVTDNNGCTIDLSETISQPLLPIDVAAVVTDILCYGDNTGAIDLTVIGGTAPFSYSWSSGHITEDVSSIPAGIYGYTLTDSKGCTFSSSATVNQPLQPLMVADVITDVNCYGESNGAIDLTVSGGTLDYTFDWSNSSFVLSETGEDIVGFPADSFRYQVTDGNGCVFIDTLVINEPPVLTSGVTGIDILCKGGDNGSVDLTVGGGVFPYTYLWSNGSLTEDINTLIAGTYTVLVTDDHNCLISDGMTLTEPMDSLEFLFTVDNVLCNDGSDGEIDLSITGGTLPYNYAWSNGGTVNQILDLTAGYYEFIITDDNGCVISDSIEVKQPDAVTLAEVITPVTCYSLSDGIIDISPVGGTMPYSYTWYNSAFGLSAQTEDLNDFPADVYQLEIIDSNGCFYEMFLEIEEPELIVIDYVYTVVSCKDGTDGNIDVTITGGNAGPSTTMWSNGATTVSLNNIPSGVYDLLYIDSKGCMDSITTEISEPDSILIDFEYTEVSCIDQADGSAYAYPNGGNGGYFYQWSNGEPTNTNVNLQNTWYSVSITDVLGCTGQDSIFITKNTIGCVFPVDAFTPNGDAYNDTWVIENLFLYPEMEMQVFNKWGNRVHYQKGEYYPWDGTFNGEQLPSDTYYYILNLNSQEKDPLKGTITILR